MLTTATLHAAARDLAERDRDLRRLLAADGPPPLWKRRPGFETLVRIILEQQVSLASARAIFRRLLRGVGAVTPGRVAQAGVDRLRSLGLTRQKAAYCVHVAGMIREGTLDLGAVARMDDVKAAGTLLRVKGVGRWTADIYLLMALGRPDVWPSGDIALARAAARVKRLRGPLTDERLARVASGWRPFRSVAARMLWHHYLTGKAREAEDRRFRDSPAGAAGGRPTRSSPTPAAGGRRPSWRPPPAAPR
jgi:DNA-3-methyladenine glycosylase II